MDINYRILWFEDTDESFETLSRRTERYVNSKNLKCKIDRIWGASDFNIASMDLNTYEILVVDLRLAEGSKGFDIINIIRSGNYVNDILFYSAEGLDSLDRIMKENRLEGVYISDRNHRTFMPKIQRLIDKSIRRSENVINIRGVVMDETSEFDTQMCEITNAAFVHLNADERINLKTYINSLLLKSVETASTLAEKYKGIDGWEISDVLSERDFNSMMKAKTLNTILNYNNARIKKAVDSCKDALPQAFRDNKAAFVAVYDNEVIKFRNKLAHVKKLNAKTPVFIGKINDVDYYCDADFCSMIRSRLIQYGDWFNKLFESLVDES
jgi:hypothetical protein